MLINEKLISLNCQGADKESVIRELALLASNEGRLIDIEKYTAAVLHRESEYSTAVGFGVAIPHGKTDAVKEPFLLFGKVNSVDWASLDGSLVDLVFMIGVPEAEADSLHLKILAALSRKLMKEPFREALRKADSAEALIQVLKEYEIGI